MKFMTLAMAEPDVTPRRWTRRILMAGVALAVVSIVATLAAYRSQMRKLDGMLVEIRARNEPLTEADLEALYVQPPPDQNATQLWLTAVAKMNEAPKSDWDIYQVLPCVGDADRPPLPPGAWPQLPLAEQFLRERGEAIAALHAAAKFEGRARYPGRILATPPQYASALAWGAAWLRLEAIVHAYRRDATRVADSLAAVLAVAHSLEDQPSFSAYMWMTGVHADMSADLRRLLATTDFADEDLARLQHDLMAADFRRGMQRALYAERVQGLAYFGQAASAGPSDPTMFAARLVRHADQATFLAMIAEWIAVAEEPWSQMLAEGDAVSARWKARVGPLHVLTKQLSYIDSLHDIAVRRETSKRLSIIAIALERYRRRHGRPATRLDDLSPDFMENVPDDPTSGAPYRYLASDTGYIVFSPSQRFPIPYGYTGLDAETGANPGLLFRWPPLDEEPIEKPDAAN